MRIFQLTITALTIVGVLLSCTENKPDIPEGFPDYTVKYHGALKNMMHKGDLSAKAQLSDISGYDHVYAIGAMENLKGEIQVFDGASFNTTVDNGKVSFDPTFDRGAALLVYSVVKEWEEVEIHKDVKTMEDLQRFIEITADDQGFYMHDPFPFLIEGTPESFDWHVIDWPKGDTVHTHEKHVESGLHGTVKNKEVELLGFYSDSHHTIFTHHTTNMHIHVKTKDGILAGHLDDIILKEGMILKLPKE